MDEVKVQSDSETSSRETKPREITKTKGEYLQGRMQTRQKNQTAPGTFFWSSIPGNAAVKMHRTRQLKLKSSRLKTERQN
jgi:hypothetical protein